MATVHLSFCNLFEWYQQSNLQFMVVIGMYLWKIAIVLQQKLLGNVFGNTSSEGQALKTTTVLRTVMFSLSLN